MVRSPVGMLVLLTLMGCSSAPTYNDNSNDPQAYARDVKQVASTAISTARRSREPADALNILVRELEDQQKVRRPIGEFKETYDQILAEVKPLHDACAKAGGKIANLPQRLDTLQKLVDKLPGEVQESKNR